MTRTRTLAWLATLGLVLLAGPAWAAKAPLDSLKSE